MKNKQTLEDSIRTTIDKEIKNQVDDKIDKLIGNSISGMLRHSTWHAIQYSILMVLLSTMKTVTDFGQSKLQLID